MQAPVPFICHLEQWIQTQGFPLDTKKLSSADSDSPLNLSGESSREEALDPKETAAPQKSRLERKKGQGKRKRKLNDAEAGDGDEHFRWAFDEIKS